MTDCFITRESWIDLSVCERARVRVRKEDKKLITGNGIRREIIG